MNAIALVTTALVLATLGCASASPAPDAPSKTPQPDPFAELRWGMSENALHVRYPEADNATYSMSWKGTYLGRAAHIRLALEDTGLSGITVLFQSTYPSMDVCGGDWARVRADMNRTYGPSQSDNLAAYWTTDARAITLSCDPDADSAATLSVSIAPREHESDR